MADTQEIRRLILIYNADSGRLNAWVDNARKILKLNGCSLCSITHGLAGEKSEWRSCRAEIGVPIDYLHRDEIFGPMKELVGDTLPCVVAETGAGPRMLLTPDVLDRCSGSVDDFKGRLLTHAAMRDMELPATPG